MMARGWRGVSDRSIRSPAMRLRARGDGVSRRASSSSGIYLGQPYALERLARRRETIDPLALLADCARPASRRRCAFASSSGTKIMSAGCRL